MVTLAEFWFRCKNDWFRRTNESVCSTMKLFKNTKLFVDLTNIMVVHIMNNEIGCYNQLVLREYRLEGSSRNVGGLDGQMTK